MIVKITGKVDGRDIIFEHVSGDKWSATVPYDLDGMYIVEVTAVNDRGMVAYITKMLLIVDPSTLCVTLIPCDYYVSVVNSEYSVEVVYPRRCCRES